MRTLTIPNEELLPEVVALLKEGHSVTLKAKGRSMLPFIVGGKDSVVLHKPDELKVGDIVLGEIAPLKFVLHRIVKVEDKHVVLMGDGNLKETEICSIDNVSGYVSTIIHNGREVDCTTGKERIKAYWWRVLLPIRRYLLAIYKKTRYNYENKTRI